MIDEVYQAELGLVRDRERLQEILLQVQCLQALGRDVPSQLMLELEVMYEDLYSC